MQRAEHEENFVRAGFRLEPGPRYFRRENARLCVLLLAQLSLLPCSSNAKDHPPVEQSTRTISIPAIQRVKIARHADISNTYTNLEVDNRLKEATDFLQKKDSPTDVVCPVKFVRDGTLGEFDDSLFEWGDIGNHDEYDGLGDLVPGYLSYIVRTISLCDQPPTPDDPLGGTALGCKRLGDNFFLLRGDSPFWTGRAFAHEFGHVKFLPDLPLPNQQATDLDKRNLMYQKVETGGTTPGNEVDSRQCREFQNK